MADETTNSTTESKPDLTKYVPKEEHVKAVSELGSLKKALDDASSKLTSEEYISFLESRKAKASEEVKLAKESLTPDLRKALEEVTTRMQNQENVLYELLADREVALCEKNNPDFEAHRDEVAKILDDAAKNKENISVQRALEIARGRNPEKSKAEQKAEKKESKSSEKPNTTIPSNATTSSKDYKDPLAAGVAAWEEVKQKHGISGDTI